MSIAEFQFAAIRVQAMANVAEPVGASTFQALIKEKQLAWTKKAMRLWRAANAAGRLVEATERILQAYA